jgi:Protein kinase domain
MSSSAAAAAATSSTSSGPSPTKTPRRSGSQDKARRASSESLTSVLTSSSSKSPSKKKVYDFAEDESLAKSLEDTTRPGKTLLDDSVWQRRVQVTKMNLMISSSGGGGTASHSSRSNSATSKDSKKSAATEVNPEMEEKIYAAITEIDTSDQFYFTKEYVLGQRLSSGSFGTVYTTTHTLSKLEFAVKVIDRYNLSVKDTMAVFREVSILRDCRECTEPVIVGLVDFYESPAQFHVVQVYARGGGAYRNCFGLGKILLSSHLARSPNCVF